MLSKEEPDPLNYPYYLAAIQSRMKCHAGENPANQLEQGKPRTSLRYQFLVIGQR